MTKLSITDLVTSLKNFKTDSERTLANNFHLSSEAELIELHGAIGIVTETAEIIECISNKPNYDIVNLAEELADTMWYVAIFLRSSGTNELKYLTGSHLHTDAIADKNVRYEATKTLVNILAQKGGELLDLYKKKAYYNRSINEIDKDEAVYSVLNTVYMIAKVNEIDMVKALSNVINKLKVRFPEKFNSADANNRNLAEERKELEK